MLSGAVGEHLAVLPVWGEAPRKVVFSRRPGADGVRGVAFVRLGLAWAEDRATLGRNPSADPGAEMGGAEFVSALAFYGMSPRECRQGESSRCDEVRRGCSRTRPGARKRSHGNGRVILGRKPAPAARLDFPRAPCCLAPPLVRSARKRSDLSPEPVVIGNPIFLPT